MSEPIGILSDVAVAIIVMFIVPTMCCINMTERIADMYVQESVAKFENTVCSNGTIEQEVFEALLLKVNQAGDARHVEITCRTTVWEPEYEDGAFMGNAISYERKSGTDEILDLMYEKGSYKLRQNDTVEVTVWNGKGSLAFATGTVKGQIRK